MRVVAAVCTSGGDGDREGRDGTSHVVYTLGERVVAAVCTSGGDGEC